MQITPTHAHNLHTIEKPYGLGMKTVCLVEDCYGKLLKKKQKKQRENGDLIQ